MRSLHLDCETRSPVDLRKTGAYVYFDHPDTDLWCLAYAFDDEPVQLWTPGEPCPEDVAEHINNRGRIVAHNAAFERLAFIKILGPRYDWPVPKLTQWYCTMAMALAQALPAALEDACTVTQTAIQKDAKGGRVMKQMAKPRRPRKGEPADALLWWDDATRLQILYDYCMTDVEAERLLEKRLRPLSDFEQRIWWLDQEINDRGVAVDIELCEAALRIVDEQRERLDREMRQITNGEVAGTGAVNQIKAFLKDIEDLDVGESLAKDTVIELLIRDDISPRARRVLELRQEGSKTSVAKIDALLNGTQSDGRSRGLLQYHAASTGRWGGRRFQPQNIKRPVIEDVNSAIEIVRTGSLDLVEAMYGNALGVVGDCLRGMVIAPKGRKLLAADYSNIEGRVLAWLAGEQWKLEAFQLFDQGKGPDLYKLAYAKAFGMDPDDVDKSQRQVGKVMELACLAEGTLVVTSSGLKPIEQVTIVDELWDGVEWVKHRGLMDNGVREVVNVLGTEATPDHLIATGLTWRPAQELVSNGFYRSLARATGTAASSSLVLKEALLAASQACGCSAIAEENRMSPTSLTFAPVDLHVATNARKNSLRAPGDPGSLNSLGRISIAVCSTGLQQQCGAATTLATPATGTMAGVASGSTSLGKGTARPLSNTSRFWKGTTTRLWSWIASTLTRATSQGILGSYPRPTTTGTEGRSLLSRSESRSLKRVYDIAHAGPRNRFLVIGATGVPLLVHNCGYQGGVGAFQVMATGYGVKVGPQWDALKASAPKSALDRVQKAWESRGKASGLDGRTWCAAELIKTLWRDAHPCSVGFWHEMEDAAIAAVKHGEEYEVGRIRFRKKGSFLFMELPSGRELAYAFPKIDKLATPWRDENDEIVYKDTLYFKGTDSVTKQWRVQTTYGGSLVENACQAVARDVLADALLGLEAWGYQTVLTVHDEIVAESSERSGTAEHFSELMTVLPDWADGLPLVAEGYEDRRYRK
jgi:hypothetical protein